MKFQMMLGDLNSSNKGTSLEQTFWNTWA